MSRIRLIAGMLTPALALAACGESEPAGAPPAALNSIAAKNENAAAEAAADWSAESEASAEAADNRIAAKEQNRSAD